MIVLNLNDDIINLMKPIDYKIIREISKEVLKIRKDDENKFLYDKFYKSKYNYFNSNNEKNLLDYLKQLEFSNELISTEEQGNYYTWVKIDEKQIKSTSYRFYLASKPEYMHEIVYELTNIFLKTGVPVEFKFQKEAKKANSDRIIIYSDYKNKDLIEKCIKNIYDNKPYLFLDSERPLPWIYESIIPNVYLAPETPGTSFGLKFAKTLKETKDIICYLYGITDKKSQLSIKFESQEQYEKVMNFIDSIVTSLLFRNQLILSKDNRVMSIKDCNVTTYYDYETGFLTNRNYDNRGYYEALFEPSKEGREALLNNFYSVSLINSQKGVTTRFLTKEEREKELYINLYGNTNNKK